MLELYVASYSGRSPPLELKRAFGPEGGTLGRGADNQLVLPDPARHVSRVQARIRHEGGRFFLANVSEANPLFLNDTEIDSGCEGPLAPGDEVRIGLYVLGVREVRPDAQGDPAAIAAAALSRGGPPASAWVAPAAQDALDPLSALGGHATGTDPFADLLGGAGDRPHADRRAIPPVLPPAPQSMQSVRGSLPLTSPPAASARMASAPRVVPAIPSSTDPFADLLQSSVSSAGAIARGEGVRQNRDGAPSAAPARVIPDDFNPFDIPSASRRNTDDPLRDLAGSSIDLDAMDANTRHGSLLEFPLAAKTDPRDPLQGGTPSLVDALDGVDPLKLFSGEDLLGRPDELQAGQMPMPDKLPEVGSHFAPPRAIPENVEVPASENRRPEVPLPRSLQPSGLAPPGTDALQTVVAKHPTSPPTADGVATRLGPISTSSGAPDRTPNDVGWAPGRPVEHLPHPREADALLSAFLRGARVEGLAVPSGLTPELMEAIGTLVYHATAGAMELIAARQITKREIRADVTIIVPKGNNPLKFLPTPEAAIMQMLGPRMPGFTSTASAMAEVFDDLRAHEIGVIAGMRAALAEALLRFDPGALEKRLGKGGLLESLFQTSRQAKLWRLYESQFQTIYREAQDEYHALFGEAFTKAYEEQVEQDRNKRESR